MSKKMAVLDADNMVVNVIVAQDWEPETPTLRAYVKGQYAGIGFTYDEDRDAFIPPKPYESWVLDEATCLWEAPVPYPTDGADYTWDEETVSWTEITDETE
jgi:hypothetical protein